jgi:hypothetical protein
MGLTFSQLCNFYANQIKGAALVESTGAPSPGADTFFAKHCLLLTFSMGLPLRTCLCKGHGQWG